MTQGALLALVLCSALAGTPAEEAVAAYRRLGDGGRLGLAPRGLGWTLAELEENGAAKEACCEALALLRAAGDVKSEASTLDDMGNLHVQLGDPARAVPAFLEARRKHASIGNRSGEASVLNKLGAAYWYTWDNSRSLPTSPTPSRSAGSWTISASARRRSHLPRSEKSSVCRWTKRGERSGPAQPPPS